MTKKQNCTAYIPTDDIDEDDLVIAQNLSGSEAMKIAFGYGDAWRIHVTAAIGSIADVLVARRRSSKSRNVAEYVRSMVARHWPEFSMANSTARPAVRLLAATPSCPSSHFLTSV